MKPLYRRVDSYPHLRNQTPIPQYQAFPPHMQMDQSRPPVAYESWPYGGNYGYPAPFHSCCNHGYFPSFYGFRPSPDPMPSPVHFCGGYPATYPESYPAYYVPHPHYSAELPRYEYDKNMHGSYHCCGCSNHQFHQKEDKGVKIEGQEPDVVENNRNDCLVPMQMKNYPYPVVLIPQEYLKEHKKPMELEVAEQDGPHKIKPPEMTSSRKQELNPWRGWFPVDADKIKNLLNGGDEKRTQDERSKEQKREYPFPFFWMPYDNKPEEGGKKDHKDMNAGQDRRSEDQMRQIPFPIVWMSPEDKNQEEVRDKEDKDPSNSAKGVENELHRFQFVPMRNLDSDKSTDKCEDGLSAERGMEVKKTGKQKSIPVKQIDSHTEKEFSKDNERRDRSVPVKEVEDTATGKSSKIDAKRHSPSPQKTSELPPVCLRVDPLPRKKNPNGSSRSPSPDVKRQSEDNQNDTTKASASLEENTKSALKPYTSTSSNNKEVEPKKMEQKEIEVTKKTTGGNNRGDEQDGSRVHVQSSTYANADVSKKPLTEKVRKDSNQHQAWEDQVAGKMSHTTPEEAAGTNNKDSVKPAADEKKVEKKTLSEVEEAAVRIQAAYRGFETRKWDLPKKLKQIAEVRQQVADVRNRIQAFESSSDEQVDEKQKVLLGETIMRLLLKLDTIQGLHPSFREIRKSLARELITLQEKLDLIVTKKPEEPTIDACHFEPEKELGSSAKNNEGGVKQEREEARGGGECSEDACKSNHGITEPCQDQLLQGIDSEHSSKGEEISTSLSSDGPQIIDQEPSVASGVETKELDSVIEHEVDVENGVPDAITVPLMEVEAEKVVDAHELKQANEVPSEEENSVEVIDVTGDNDALKADLEELPIDVVGDEVSPKDENEVCCGSTDQFGEHEFKVSPEAVLASDVNGVMATQNDVESDRSAELPQGEIEMDPASSELFELPVGVIDEPEFKKHEQAEIENGDVLMGRLIECPTESQDEAPNEIEKPVEVMEEKPIAELGECFNVESKENEEKIPGHSVLEVEILPQEGKEVVNNEKPFLESETEESQPMISPKEKESDDAVHEDKCVLAETVRVNEIPIEKNEDDEQLPTLGRKESEGIQESMVKAPELESTKDDKVKNQFKKSEITEEELSAEDGFAPIQVQQAEKEEVPLPASPTCSKISSGESEKHLIVENEKLREMMEKLLQAGKEQMDVISSLSGRVKDLEKKLANKKKLRTKRHGGAACGTSRVKRSNAPVKERAGGVAM
ncbi:hypothetical protein UlMin_021126 [Ulmus minor]